MASSSVSVPRLTSSRSSSRPALSLMTTGGARREHGRARAGLVAVGPRELAGDGHRAGDLATGLLEARHRHRGLEPQLAARDLGRPEELGAGPGDEHAVAELDVLERARVRDRRVAVELERPVDRAVVVDHEPQVRAARAADLLDRAGVAQQRVAADARRLAAGVVVARLELDPAGVVDRRARLAEGAQVRALLEPQQAVDDELALAVDRGRAAAEPGQARDDDPAARGHGRGARAGVAAAVPVDAAGDRDVAGQPAGALRDGAGQRERVARLHGDVVGDLAEARQLDRARERALADEDDAVGGVGAGERARVGLGRAVLDAQLADLAVDDAGVVQRDADRRGWCPRSCGSCPGSRCAPPGPRSRRRSSRCRGRRSARGSRARARRPARRCR